MRRAMPSRLQPPVGAFSDRVLAQDLPDLASDRRAEVVAFVERRVASMPSPMRTGVRVAALAIEGGARLVGADRLTRCWPDARCRSRGVRAARAVAELRLHLGDLAGHDPHRRAPVTASQQPPVLVATPIPDHGRLEAEVLIIGSGAGGAPTAAILAEAGFDVLVVEEGGLVRQGEVVPFSLEQMDRQYRSGGVTAALGLPSIAYTEGCCAGGGTEVNSGLYRRAPEEVLARWRQDHRLVDFEPDELDAIAAEVEHELSVQPVPGDQIPASEALRRGAEAMGWRHDESPRWMTYPAGGDARTRSSPEHDGDLSAPGAAGRRPPDHRITGRPADPRRRPGGAGRGQPSPDRSTVTRRAARSRSTSTT